MIIKRTMGEKGQVVIPKDIRMLLGIRENVIFEVQNNEVKIKSEQDPRKTVEDFFNTPKLKKKISLKEIKKTLDEQYELH